MSDSTGKTSGEEGGYTRKLVNTTATQAISESNTHGRNQVHNTA